MELGEKDYLIGIWWYPLPDNTGDVMGSVVKKHGSNKWHLEYRFRYHADDKVFDSEDKKNWHDATLDASVPEEKVFKDVDFAFTQMAMKAGAIVDYFNVRGDVEVFMQKVQQQPPPWMHMKTVTEEEFNKQYGKQKST